ncbi:MAG: decarboxylating NADP(+)-dependent phosphogluconate dehydrogenase [Selenomonas sp.]|uniref:decarboxylating NADP(+)-dependent phosphogluconate dehydrogenase n=1 Tax=Selenomonas sp. TaxID=2053611 RepID=UPI0025E3DC17|nr:decarboxylating NADP(+)-dependent phosphogluconate dehydrogenase [Selenomonas sp.]MCR5758248.1 decarboxylating NADP(+)-dependent phosphogluconate dehydrogenase [Selenomonas sp.]
MDTLMDIGMVGMAVMGSNLALNMADKGYEVACYNYTPDLTEKVLRENPHEHLHGFYDLESFVQSLEKPRRIMFMIMAGTPVDSMIEKLQPLLEPGDMILDGGNSYFEDTRRRHELLQKSGIHYFGVGISGGESGARRGPCIMPGGDLAAYERIRPIYESIAAKAGHDICCTYIGADGAGHYVKMVHNGIEYADMQLIVESYLLLKYAGGYNNHQLADIFHQWNQGELRSFLIEITADILAEDDETGGQLLDKIVDSAGQKGTGRWTSIEALKQGVNTSMITAACNARVMSNLQAERTTLKQVLSASLTKVSVPDGFIELVRQSLYLGKIAAYAQGFSLYQAAAAHYGWNLDFGKIASIFRAGCIIRADFLEKITAAYREEPQLKNLLQAEFFTEKVKNSLPALRQVVAQAVQSGIPIPALSCGLEYIEALRGTPLGANLIQAQRDYFGAHTFERVDQNGSFHHAWKKNF